MIGQSTGGWTDQDYNIVDISSGTAKDPQGNVHHLPKEITFPTFSKGNRIINCFEVK